MIAIPLGSHGRLFRLDVQPDLFGGVLLVKLIEGPLTHR